MKVQTPSDLARLVKNARTQQNLTQQNLADAVGITRQSLARLERGNGGTSFDTVLRILDHLDIHLDATSKRRTAPTTASATSAAQSAADALAKRSTPLIALEALNKHSLGSLPPNAAPILGRFDASGILKHAGLNLEPAALASILDAAWRLGERPPIPGSVLSDPPRAVEADPPADADQDLTDTGDAE